jgi:hypothetical protein
MSTGQRRIAELAKQAPSMSFTNLAQHIDYYTLYMAFLRTRKDGAVGVDGQTAEAYAENLRGNLEAGRSRRSPRGVGGTGTGRWRNSMSH